MAAKTSRRRGSASSAIHEMAAVAWSRGAICHCLTVNVSGRAREGLFVDARWQSGGGGRSAMESLRVEGSGSSDEEVGVPCWRTTLERRPWLLGVLLVRKIRLRTSSAGKDTFSQLFF